VQPHLKPSKTFFRNFPPDVCPVGGAFERNPDKYQWDSSLSGRRLDEVDEDSLLFEGPITCPYHKRPAPQNVSRLMQSLESCGSQPAAEQGSE
jgi:hypothetical protein